MTKPISPSELKIDITLSDKAEKLLTEISKSEEPSDYSFDIYGPEMEELDKHGLIQSIVGEQFYLSNLGSAYLIMKK